MELLDYYRCCPHCPQPHGSAHRPDRHLIACSQGECANVRLRDQLAPDTAL